ncbi:uncharacterized protein LOC110036391 [Phalaenopsis equestris]|uniref:uncharacterized protein LOC110036391 n=1 Tax=Phalaenopsis equestris TaxID=78828 RepID=UPI0009E46657|nr:uncharacterized protein LOC110036391 [Phalaenopsis equestris]
MLGGEAERWWHGQYQDILGDVPNLMSTLSCKPSKHRLSNEISMLSSGWVDSGNYVVLFFLFMLRKAFDYFNGGPEIFSSWTHKAEHFQRIHRRTGVPFNSMLFFDDEYRNIDTVSKMGVTSILVDNGVNLQELYSGLDKFSKNSKLADMNKTDL